jgi:hypothetical protein
VNRANGLVPATISLLMLAFLATQIDFASALKHLDARVARILLPALAAYAALSWWIEALSLERAARHEPRIPTWTYAKIKAASYPLAIIHYAIGAGGLAYLLRRRADLGLSQAAGAVLIISLIDLGLVVLLTALGAAFIASETVAVRGGLVAAAVILMTLGFGFLRAPFSLGPLDRIRALAIFQPARDATASLLLTLGLLRLGFVGVFVGIGGAALAAFGVSVPFPDLVVNICGVALVAALPIAVAGLGTGQVAFVYLFSNWADSETLLACSLTLSASIIAVRAALGAIFAWEFAREAYGAVREANS